MNIRGSFNHKIAFTIFIFVFVGQLWASNGDNYSISKCSRLQIGEINSFYTYNEKTFSPGFIIEHNYCLKPKETLGYGIGTGLIIYKEQTFLPIYLDFIACHKSNFFGNLQGGYSFGWESNTNFYGGYSFKGGIYTSLGLGWKFKISSEFKSCISLNYIHQFANLSSETLANKNLNFNSLSITIGIMLETK